MPLSLLEQLQVGAVDSSVPIIDLLAKAKLAAAKLRHVGFTEWVENEITGYPSVPMSQYPEYRRVPSELKGLQGRWTSLNFIVPYPVGASVAELQQMVVGSENHILITLDPAAEQIVREAFPGLAEIRLAASISRPSLARTLAGIRNEVLNWVLKLDEAGIRGDGLSFSDPEIQKAQSITINNHFHAAVAGLHQGTGSITGTTQNSSSATPQEMADALASLIVVLQNNAAAGTPFAAITDLVAAQKEVKAGRMPLARVRGILAGLKDTQDLAIRAPDVMRKMQDLWQMFGG